MILTQIRKTRVPYICIPIYKEPFNYAPTFFVEDFFSKNIFFASFLNPVLKTPDLLPWRSPAYLSLAQFHMQSMRASWPPIRRKLALRLKQPQQNLNPKPLENLNTQPNPSYPTIPPIPFSPDPLTLVSPERSASLIWSSYATGHRRSLTGNYNKQVT